MTTPDTTTRVRKSRSRGIRTKTGCLTCRKRHLKCDELKPRCGLCARSDKICHYPEISARAQDGRGSDIQRSAPDPSPQASSVDDSTGSNATGEDGRTDQSQDFWDRTLNDANMVNQSYSFFPSRSDNFPPTGIGDVGPQRHSPLQTQGHDNRQPSGEDPPSVCNNPQLAPLQATDPVGISPDAGTDISFGSVIDVATARWFGMLANDADFGTMNTDGHGTLGSQCPTLGAVPDISNFLDMSAERPSWALFTDGVLGQIGPASDQATSRPYATDRALWKSPDAILLQDTEQHLFEVFVNRISSWIDLFDPFRHFCTLVPRLAMYNVGLLAAILALSVRYLSLNPAFANGNIYRRHDALRYYHESLHYVQSAMRHGSYLTSLELLATALIISAYEMLDGSRKDWEKHLQGVFGIQRSQVIHGDTGGLRAAVWWAWLQQDVWAAFRDKRKTFTFWIPVRTLDEMNPWEVAARSFFLMAKVINYCSEIEQSGEGNNIQARINAAERLESMLDDWKRHLSIEFTPLPTQRVAVGGCVFKPQWTHPAMFGVAMQIYNAAQILLILHKPTIGGLNSSIRRQRQLDRHVEAIGGIAITLTDYGSSVASSQCLFIAGMCTSDERKRQEILRLIDLCRQRTGWPVNPMEGDLKAIWDTSEPC
ncbi:hypothetical protein ABEF92_002003 [Exophiala dermatitidis]|uniref:Zn(2)-C6 fungal-type domain-containing protein n=1 Tax=Exophiala dermatitidis (strain ATCC 34100 / CBS 525.76 / NIH/UT8656) TaxID=858893 RepID=H6C2N0_EXODN|nr:uncharacterized protein HMPREF1120_05968 [Exophiala dermatitidis NIH/UT8656]EHY57948.1 hypothetical protein HMPREF1120_05968 [Exophiala dermatitidis NIH/UT8656]